MTAQQPLVRVCFVALSAASHGDGAESSSTALIWDRARTDHVEVGGGKVISCAQQWETGPLGEGVSEAVSEVQCCTVPALVYRRLAPAGQ